MKRCVRGLLLLSAGAVVMLTSCVSRAERAAKRDAANEGRNRTWIEHEMHPVRRAMHF